MRSEAACLGASICPQPGCGSLRWTIALKKHIPIAYGSDSVVVAHTMTSCCNWYRARNYAFPPPVNGEWLCCGYGHQASIVTAQGSQQCAIMRAEDGRWRARPCTEEYPSACRTEEGEWVLGVGGSRGGCPGGASFALPAHAKENAALQRELMRSGQQACWLPLKGVYSSHSALPL